MKYKRQGIEGEKELLRGLRVGSFFVFSSNNDLWYVRSIEDKCIICTGFGDQESRAFDRYDKVERVQIIGEITFACEYEKGSFDD